MYMYVLSTWISNLGDVFLFLVASSYLSSYNVSILYFDVYSPHRCA